MTSQELHRAVARATGEDPELIARRGFSLVDEEPAADDELLGRFLDWDEMECRSPRAA